MSPIFFHKPEVWGSVNIPFIHTTHGLGLNFLWPGPGPPSHNPVGSRPKAGPQKSAIPEGGWRLRPEKVCNPPTHMLGTRRGVGLREDPDKRSPEGSKLRPRSTNRCAYKESAYMRFVALALALLPRSNSLKHRKVPPPPTHTARGSLAWWPLLRRRQSPILQNIAGAMRPDSRIVVADACIPNRHPVDGEGRSD